MTATPVLTRPPQAAESRSALAVSYAQANPLHRAVRWFAATPAGDWLFATVLRRLDAPVYRLTSGRHTAANLLSGLPVVQLTTTGARTGRPRTVPVLGVPTSAGLAVFASNFGRQRHPGWYHNLRARPSATVTVRGSATRVCAVEAGDEQRAQIWRRGLEIFPGWASYERRAGSRSVAVFLLVPDGPPEPSRDPAEHHRTARGDHDVESAVGRPQRG
jgi:deazaflavin-dependent oxidoreductase (nitroreductase family)